MRNLHVILFLGLLSACTPKGLTEVLDPYISLDRDTVAFAPDAATGRMCDTVTVCCNRGWSTVLRYSSDSAWIDVGLREESNLACLERSARVALSVSENVSVLPRTAVLSFYSEGQVRNVFISQPRYVPRVGIDRGRTRQALLPLEDSLAIVFSANDDWTASLASSQEGVSLSRTSGGAGTDSLYLRMGTNVGTGVSRAATVILRCGESADSVTVTQKSWHVIEAVFSNGSSLVPSAEWPFLYPAQSSLSSASKRILAGQRVECTMRDGSPSFYVQSAGGLWKNSAQGFNFTCSDPSDGLELPVIDSLGLAAVELTTGYRKAGVLTSVVDTAGVDVPGCIPYEFLTIGETHLWFPTSVDAGAVCRLRAATVMIRSIRVYYE